jgi:hypothetical protein
MVRNVVVALGIAARKLKVSDNSGVLAIVGYGVSLNMGSTGISIRDVAAGN